MLHRVLVGPRVAHPNIIAGVFQDEGKRLVSPVENPGVGAVDETVEQQNHWLSGIGLVLISDVG